MAKHRRLPGCGRHRRGTPRLVYCRDLAPVRTQLQATRAARGPWILAWLFAARLRGRHTAVALTQSGARPRPAFALIASL